MAKKEFKEVQEIAEFNGLHKKSTYNKEFEVFYIQQALSGAHLKMFHHFFAVYYLGNSFFFGKKKKNEKKNFHIVNHKTDLPKT